MSKKNIVSYRFIFKVVIKTVYGSVLSVVCNEYSARTDRDTEVRRFD